MRVLVVHNRYSSLVPSGENLSVENEVTWLREQGVEVELFTVSNDDAIHANPTQQLAQAASTVWSMPAARRMERLIEAYGPDIVHVHNLFPLLSASVAWAAHRRRIPIVWTARNQRLTCVDGTHFRAGAPCHSCHPRWRLAGVGHACYRGSRPASALVTAATSLFGGIARRNVTSLAISHWVRNWLVSKAGFPADRVFVKYNGITGPLDSTPLAPAASRRVFLFAGKLAPYKGLELLLEAWSLAGDVDAELRIVGDGPMADAAIAAASRDPRIAYLGQVGHDEIATHLEAARVVTVPSVWDEPFGRVAAEALAFARPVITTGLGGLGEIVDADSGWVTGVDIKKVATAIREASTSDTAVSARAEAAKARHARMFSPEITTASLVALYDHLTRAGR